MGWKIYNSVGEQRVVAAGVDTASLSGTTAIANGGTGQVSSTAAFDALAPTSAAKGDVLVFDGTHWIRKAIGSDGQYLKADSAQSDGTAWSDIASMPDVFLFGDGSDGDVSISGTVILTRDMYYHNLTISSASVLNTNGWRVFVSGILDMTATPSSGHINNKGIDATLQPAAAGGAGNSVGGGSDGIIGAAITSVQGGVSTATDAGGQGGLSGTSFTVATAATRNALTGIRPRRLTLDLIKGIFVALTGGSGGGGGNSANAVGGGGGGGGGVIFIAARTINRSASNFTIINANGGIGGSGTAGGVSAGGGGGGGGGGLIYVIYRYLTGSTQTLAMQTSGGLGGVGGIGATHGGNGGGGGDSGVIQTINVSTGIMTTTTGTSGSAGSAAVGTAGGVAGSGGSNIVSL